MKNISVLGSTGSIGRQTLDVVEAFPDRFKVCVLVANRSWQLLAQQARKFKPQVVAVGDEKYYPQLKEALQDLDIQILAGREGVLEASSYPQADIVLSALVGVAGLFPTVAALQAGKTIALANKETLVVGGEIVTKLAQEKGLPLLPVDSEHSAIFQCLQGQPQKSLKRILLTASGGPFRQTPKEKLANMRASDALQHPTWSMGAKITIDSSTLMNKGFEVLEAMHLFQVSMGEIEVWVHPQSIVHSMVEFVDGSVLAQLGLPDMRTPIQYALGWPERLPHSWETLTLDRCTNLTFEKPRWDDFPCLGYAFEAGKIGGSMPCVVNAANEIAVANFLQDRITFADIPATIRHCMDVHKVIVNPTLQDLEAVDIETRASAESFLNCKL
ncbi:1-deoxy-D-xylulose-5-phosphate reductoisomerase [bacterium]|nr:1-deoxy-D-xylulose-5-phosphate reductoisomerase [bacterium]